MWINLDDFLIVADYAKHIGKTETRIRQLIRENKLPYIEHNRRKLIPKTGVLPEYIKEQEDGVHGFKE